MRRYLTLAMLVFSGWANALTLSPMLVDELTTTDLFEVEFKLYNKSASYQEYNVTVQNVTDNERLIYKSETVVGASDSISLFVPISGVAPDKKQVYRVCVSEQETEGRQVLLRICARVRLYWPRSILSRQ